MKCMKQWQIGGALLLALGCGPGDQPTERRPLQHTQDSLSYAVGVFLGQTYREQGVSLDPARLQEGLQDALTEGPPRLPDSLVQGLVQRLEAQAQQRQQARLARHATENLAAARAFLANNRSQPGIIERPSGLQYRVLAPGSGAPPTLANEVRLWFQGHLLDGTRIDDADRLGGEVVLRVDEVLPGWSEALIRMAPGARWELFVPPHLAYGERGRSPLVPPQALVIFELELREIVR